MLLKMLLLHLLLLKLNIAKWLSILTLVFILNKAFAVLLLSLKDILHLILLLFNILNGLWLGVELKLLLKVYRELLSISLLLSLVISTQEILFVIYGLVIMLELEVLVLPLMLGSLVS